MTTRKVGGYGRTPMESKRSRPLVSAAIIVRDEADFLRTCLTSISPLCDEIVVVDTGSSDDSVEVARSFGAVLGYRQWDGNFSAARNTALDLATGEWILYIDADERIENLDADAARSEIEAATNAVALRVRFKSRPQFTAYREYRMWRHRPDIRFQNQIHETMVPDLNRIEAEEGLSILDIDSVEICHYGYEGDQTRKHLRNLPLLEIQVVDTPQRCYLWDQLGLTRDALGDPVGAVEAWETGVGLIRELGLVDRTDIAVYVNYALHLIAWGRDATGLIDEGLAMAPWCAALDWAAALNHRAFERYDESIPHLRRLIDTSPDDIDPAVGYQVSMLTDWALAELADSLFHVGDLRGSATMYRRAADTVPDDRSLLVKAVAVESYANSKADLHQVGEG